MLPRGEWNGQITGVPRKVHPNIVLAAQSLQPFARGPSLELMHSDLPFAGSLFQPGQAGAKCLQFLVFLLEAALEFSYGLIKRLNPR